MSLVLDDLFARHADTVYRYLRVRLPAADAEEVTQDVFVVAWHKPDQIPANEISWLLGVARKLAANRRRAIDHQSDVAARHRDQAEVFFPDHADAVGEADLATRALRRLSRADQDVIQLLIARDLTQDELALALGCKPGAAAVRVHRARARLKEAFEIEERESTAAEATSATTTRDGGTR